MPIAPCHIIAPCTFELMMASIKTRKGAVVINAHHTDIVCTNFDDRLFIVITQLQKLGTLVQASKDVVLEESAGSNAFTTKVLLGSDEPEIHVIARNLAGTISSHKPILFALALKDSSPQTLRALTEILPEYKCW